MKPTPSIFAAWHLAEQDAKLLFAQWKNALDAGDASACELEARLRVQRGLSHAAFVKAVEDCATLALAVRNLDRAIVARPAGQFQPADRSLRWHPRRRPAL